MAHIVLFFTTVSDHGVLVDSQLTMPDHVAAVSGVPVPAMPTPSGAVIVHWGISRDAPACILNYCNSSMYGVSDQLPQKLQVIQNAAAYVVRKRRSLITSLRWYTSCTGCLSINLTYRIRFHLVMWSCQMPEQGGATVSGWSCSSLCSVMLVSSLASRQHLRSANTQKLVVQWTWTVLSAMDFAVSCAVICNSLPTDLRVLSLTAAAFTKHLKLIWILAWFCTSEDC